MRRLPPLTALPAFEAVARLGSVKAAAEELGRTHGAVSKQIRHLAEDLGVALFEKEGVGLRLSAQGERLRAVAERALDSLDAVSRSLRAEASMELIELGVSATFAMRWLMPRMPRFYQRRPGAEVRLLMTGRTRLSDSEADAILTWDRLSWAFSERQDLRILGDVAFCLVCAPDYPLERRDGVCRVETRIGHEGTPQAWPRWEALAGVRLAAAHETAYPHTFLALEAALAGLGVALTERRLIESELAEGRLVAPFGFVTIAGGFGAILPERGRNRSAVGAFLDWLEEEAGDDAGRDRGAAPV